jgi:hypothetical protein
MIHTHDHRLQLFDTSDSLFTSVASYLTADEARGQRLMVVATAAHWRGIADALRTRGFDVDGSMATGRLMVHDAPRLLTRFMRRGKPVRGLFVQNICVLVADLVRTSPGGLRIYGEMVEVLAQEGNYLAAERLETLWNELGRQYSFTLLCGYAAAHFAAPDGAGALAAICAQHSRAVSHPADSLSDFLLARERIRTGGGPPVLPIH